LARLLAEQLHVTLETIPLPQDEILTALRQHQAHLAAAPLRSENYPAALRFGPGYQRVRELVVCNKDNPLPEDIDDLTGRKLGTTSGSTQESALREARNNFPSLQWQTDHHLTTPELLAEVSEGTLDCAIASELQLADARNYHSNLVANFEIAPPSKLAWGFPEDADPKLIEQVQTFFNDIQRDGSLNRLLDRYYGHNNRLRKMDAAAFINGINTVLPHYRRMFEEAATLTGFDWRLLAALAYQ
jgi:membrane-bound lytic murein transglycosylase F